MNCTRIEKLIPLYTGGDLPDEEETAVRNHLASCEKCAGIAAEFEESRDWLRGYASPHFDQPVFDDLRDHVLTKIARAQTRPSLFELLAPVFNRRFAFASALTLALLVAGMIFYFNRKTNQTPDISHKSKNGVMQKNNADNPTMNTQPAGEQEKTALRHFSRRSTIIVLPYVTTPDPKTIALKSDLIDLRLITGEAGNLSIVEIQTAEVSISQEMMRFEFQTADPNIRIIWLTPKESKHNSETR